MEVKSSNRTYIIVACIIGFFLITFLVAGFMGGKQGVYGLMGNYFKLLFICIMIAMILGIGYMLFIWEKRIDAPFEVSKDITSETKTNKPDKLKRLFIKGDKIHPSKCYGKILGWSSRQNMKKINKKEEKKKYYTRESIFLVSESFFKNIVIRCPEDMHDSLHGDVYINDIGLVKHKYFYYPSTLHLDFESIDETQWEEANRWVNMEIPALFHQLLKKASGILEKDEKAVEPVKGVEQLRDQAS